MTASIRGRGLNGFQLFCPTALIAILGLSFILFGSRAAAQVSTFAGDAQHTANYSTPAQPLNAIHWSTSVDLHNTGALGHYGAPLITASNTIIVPVKITNGFQISAFEAATGRLKYTLTNDFIPAPYATNGWFPVYQPVLALPPSGPRLYYPGPGGTVYSVENPDSDTPNAPVQQCFYTNLAGYTANAGGSNGFNHTLFINTPITADSNGVIYFGFRAQGTIPAPLNTTNDGFARLDPNGNGTYVLAGTAAANDPFIYHDSHNCAPALSNDGLTLYVAVKGPNNYAYLVGLDSATLATKFRVLLLDPHSGLRAVVQDNATASPMVAPDGEVFFGVLGSPNQDSRGYLLHFHANLQTNGPPGAFGWDNTAAIVPTNMVPSYTGTSPYLLFTKYNNYAGNGDGVNRLAILDPNATQIDPHPIASRLIEMREILSVIGPTPDPSYQSSNYPYAVREWCVNTVAVNPSTKSVFSPSEDGHLYRWDLAANSLAAAVHLDAGIGEAYVPTIIGPDGTIFTINGGILFAIGGLTNVGISLASSAPDLRPAVVGQFITFTALVTNLSGSGPAPTGTVTFLDQTWTGLVPITNTLATNVSLSNGIATLTTSALSASTNQLGSHLITAKYSGDGVFPPGSATMVQKIHRYASSSALFSASIGSSNAVTFTATVAPSPPSPGTPSGLVSFWDGANCFAQIPLNSNGIAICTNSNYTVGSHAISATYASDTLFAASTGQIVPSPPNPAVLIPAVGEGIQLNFSNAIGAPFSVLSSPDVQTPLTNWSVLGSAVEFLPGNYRFTDSTSQNPQRFYRVRSP